MSSPKHDPAEPAGASPAADGSPGSPDSPPDSLREGSGGGGDDGGGDGGSPDRHHKHKKEKKEKKHKDKDKKRHKDKKHKEKRRHHGHDGEAEAEAGPAAAEEPAAVADEGRGGGAPEPAPLPPADAGAAKHASPAHAAAGGAEEEEEGELPGELGGEAADRLGGRDERRRRSRSPSQSTRRPRSSERNGRDRTRSRTRSRSQPRRERSRRRTRSRSPPREPSRGPGASGPPRDRSREGRPREDSRRRSRSPAERRRSCSPADRRRPRSRSPPRRAPLPPLPRDSRGGYLDRRPYDRRPGYDQRDRYGGGRDGRFDDRRVGWDDRRRPRSRSRSRDTRKRSRSDERRQQAEQREQEDEEQFQARVAAALEAQQGEDEDRLIEERRRRRAEILAKHRSQQDLAQMAAAPTTTAMATEAAQQQQQQQGGQQQAGAAPAAPAAEQAEQAQAVAASDAAAPGSRPASAAPPAAGEDEGPEPDLSDHEDVVLAQLGTTQQGALNIFREGAGGEGGAGPESAAPSEMPPKSGTGEAVDTELQKRLEARKTAEPSIFDEDADDIFAATPTDVKEKEAAAAAAAAAGPAVAPGAGARKGLLDNYDDAEGYYNFQVGEVIGEPGGAQYEVYATHGKGVFSSVLRARDLSRRDHDSGTYHEVAIKVIRANETMYKAGQMERVILRKLSEADPEGKRHCIRQLGSFEYRNHLCLVFEAMDMNLRELTKRYGRGIGLSINAVRVYAQQMLVGLYHLKNCGVLHADIKPDNILVNDRRTVVKLCDFGSAMFSGDNEITPYLVSRFYRAPEVILGLPYEYPMDMWSIGCVVYELFTGHILFPGKTNNEMLKLMMDVKGPFPKKMIKRAEFAFKHFEADPNMSFALLEEDPVTKRPVRRLISNPTIKKDFSALLAGQSPDRRKLAQLVDLLERMMQLDPDKRISPKDALRHPFIKEPPSGAAK
ncbi:hypothetical protein ABPG75_007712 [Micractinium tetrahymenae]